MISNIDIYERTINLIDDPDLNRMYLTNKIEFQKTMYKFLLNGLSYFTAPTRVCDMLEDQTAPDGETEIAEGTGGFEYKITTSVPEEAETAFYIYAKDSKGKLKKTRVSGEIEKREDGDYVVFQQPVNADEQYEVQWYTAGTFNGDFAKAGPAIGSSMNKRVIEILARTTVIAWAEREQNFLLDIRNLLNDTDFKLYSPANSLEKKKDWVESLRFEIYSLQNKLDWDLRNRSVSRYGY